MITKTKEIKCFTCSNTIVVSKYLSKYTICSDCKNKGIISQIPTRNKTKTIKCYFCNNMVNVGLTSTGQVRCIECKKKGFITPDSLLKTERRKKSIIEKYGVENISSLDNIKEKKKENRRRKIETNSEYLSEIERKRKETIIEKYGSVENYYAIISEKSSESYYEKTGYKSPAENPEVIKKIEQTKLEKYGDKNYHNIEKTKQTNLERYGVQWPTQSGEVKYKIKEIQRKKFISKLKELLDYLNLEILEEYKHAHFLHKFRCKKCGTIFEKVWNFVQQGSTCPNCLDKNYKDSKAEKELKDFVSSFGFKTIFFNNRNLIYPWELDIVIDHIKTAIEFCGLWYHSEEVLKDSRKNLMDPRRYHSMKREMCLEKGYKLITIFEDEWIFNKNIVLNRLKQIFGKSKAKRIHARDCIIKEISSDVKNSFLTSFHIQGKDNSIIKLGAFYDNELVSVMTFSYGNISKGSKKQENIWELNRFCSNYTYHIPGVAGKLLSYFTENYTWDEIFTYADLRWSNGNLYYKLGFSTDNKIRLNYWYVKNNNRIHRFNLRKRKDEPKNITEMVLRVAEGYSVIWDCGNLKFKLINTK